MKESQKLTLRKSLMTTFLIGSILLGLVLVGGSIYVAIEILLTYKEHGIFGYGTIPTIVIGIVFGVLIPWFVVPLARIALESIKKEKEILLVGGIEELRNYRETNELIYPKKLGLNKNKNIT